MNPSSITQAFNPYGMNKQETAYFNRAVGHAYKAAKARAKWFGRGAREASAETAAENSDISTVGTLLFKRGIDVTFKDIFAHVNARGIALATNHRSYSYGGYSYAAPTMAYYTNPLPGYSYGYWDANDAFLIGLYGGLAFSAIDNAYMQDQYYDLQRQDYFNDFNNGGYNDIIETYPDTVVVEGGAPSDDPGFYGTDVTSNGWGGGGDFVTESDVPTGGSAITGGDFSDGNYADTTAPLDVGGSDFANTTTTDNSGGGWGGGGGSGSFGGGISDPDPVDNSGGGWGGGGGSDFGGGTDSSSWDSGGGSDF